MRRPLVASIRSTSSVTWAAGQHDRGELVATVARDEDPRRLVDPDLLDLRVVEQRLERAEAGDVGDQERDQRVPVGHRGDRSGQAAVVVVAHDLLGHLTHHRGLTLRVDAAPLDLGAQDAVEVVDDVAVGQRPGETDGPGRQPRPSG